MHKYYRRYIFIKKVMKMDKEILKKLDERLAKGEISEETYKSIKARYEDQEEIEHEEFQDEGIEPDEEVGTGEKTKRVSLSGASKTSEVDCEYFSSSGASKVEGFLKADKAKISGATTVAGDAYLGEVDVSGSFKVEGSTEAEHMDISGASKFQGKVEAKKVISKGASKFVSDVNVEDFKSSGSLKIEGDFTGSRFKASGSFKLEGGLKADEILLNPGGDCKILKIIGGDILVESGGGGFFSLFKKGTLKVETISGDKIYLENTIADTVKGNDVRIGPGCKIESVKAKDLKVHESSSVRSKTKI